MTDSQGRVVSFKNAILIMTSNLGSAMILDAGAAAAAAGIGEAESREARSAAARPPLVALRAPPLSSSLSLLSTPSSSCPRILPKPSSNP